MIMSEPTIGAALLTTLMARLHKGKAEQSLGMYMSTRDGNKEITMEFKDYELDEFKTMGAGDPDKEKIEEEIYEQKD